MKAREPLTEGLRRTVCVHEAGHAVVFALGGYDLFRIAVAPLGATEWAATGRKGGALIDLWGMCEVMADHPARGFLHWTENDDRVTTDRRGFRQYLREAEDRCPGARREAWRSVRARLCAAVAGPIAEQLHNGEEAEIDYEGWPGVLDDAKQAVACDGLLPWRNELEALHGLTLDTLRRPDVWALVQRLADELERTGELLDDLDHFLPAQVPNWPPSPRARKAPPFILSPLEITA